LPGPGLSLLDLDQVRFIGDILRQDVENAKLACTPKAAAPSQYWQGIYSPNDNYYYDSPEDFRGLNRLFHELGLNALDYGPALNEARSAIARDFTGAVYYFRVLGDSDISALVLSYNVPAISDALVRKTVNWTSIPNGNDIASIFAQTPDRVVINVNDE